MLNRFFVGRDNEKRLIDTIWNSLSEQTSHVFNLYGEKGIGKTSLLRELEREWKDKFSAPAIVFIDFDSSNPFLRHVKDEIAETLDPKKFEAYLRASEVEAGYGQEQRPDHVYLNALQTTSRETFLECYNTFAATQSVLLIFDTCEQILNTNLLDPFLLMLASLPNTLIVLAGCRNERLQGRLQSLFEQNNITSRGLDPLDDQEFDAMRERLPILQTLTEGQWETLEYLTDRKPLPLHLAAAWLDRNLELPPLINQPVKKLKDKPEAVKERFQQELVQTVTSLSSQIDLAILYMAYLLAPADQQLLSYLLEVDEDEAQAIIGELEHLFFVRRNHTLQDYMRELVKKYSWEALDPVGNQREFLFKKLESYYWQEELPRDSWLEAVNVVRQLHYRLLQDLPRSFNEIMTDFYEKYDKAIRRELVLDELLRDEWLEDKRFNSEMQIWLDSKLAYLLARQGRFDEAMELIGRIMSKKALPEAVKLEVNMTRGLLVEFNPNEASTHLDRAQDIAVTSKNWLNVVTAKRNYASGLQKLGQFTTATELLLECVTLSQKNNNWLEQARSYNSLAFVYMQQGDNEQAMAKIQLAEYAYKKSKAALPAIQGAIYQTKARIYEDMGENVAALTYIERAENILEDASENSLFVQVMINKTRIYRKQHRANDADEVIKRALSYLEGGQNRPLLAQAYNERASEYRKRGWQIYRDQKKPQEAIRLFKLAREDYEKSANYAKAEENFYFLASILSDEALLCYYWAEATDDEEEQKELHRKLDDLAQHTIYLSRQLYLTPAYYESRVLQTRGNVAFAKAQRENNNGQYFKAFVRFYFPACERLSQAEKLSSQRLNEVARTIEAYLLTKGSPIPVWQIRRICEYFLRRWKELGLDREEKAPKIYQRYQDYLLRFQEGDQEK